MNSPANPSLEREEVYHIPETFTKSGRKRAVPFPCKLMHVITQKEYSDMIAWQEDGKSIKILLPSVFTAKVLPVYFKEAKYSSFKRKLHRWGFERQRGSDDCKSSNWFGSEEVFYHKNFQRSRIDLLQLMIDSKPMAQANVKPAGPVMPTKSKTVTKVKGPAIFVVKPAAAPAKAKDVNAIYTNIRPREEQQNHHSLPLSPAPKRIATESAAVMRAATFADFNTHAPLPRSPNASPAKDPLSALMELEISRRVREAGATAATAPTTAELMEHEISRRVRERLVMDALNTRTTQLLQRSRGLTPSVDTNWKAYSNRNISLLSPEASKPHHIGEQEQIYDKGMPPFTSYMSRTA